MPNRRFVPRLARFDFGQLPGRGWTGGVVALIVSACARAFVYLPAALVAHALRPVRCQRRITCVAVCLWFLVVHLSPRVLHCVMCDRKEYPKQARFPTHDNEALQTALVVWRALSVWCARCRLVVSGGWRRFGWLRVAAVVCCGGDCIVW